jgi:hypothetical protein
MGQQNLIGHHVTNHGMKLFGSNKYDVMAENSVSFGSSLSAES